MQAEVRILDSEGHLVFDACPELNFTLEGDGEIIGIDNGDPACHEQWKETKGRHAFNGMAYAVIRAGQNKGELKLTVTSQITRLLMPSCNYSSRLKMFEI